MADPDAKPVPAAPPVELSADQVRHVARLARLAIDDEEVERQRTGLAAVLKYIERLRELDLAGIEPLTHPGELVNRLDDDEPGPTLAPDALAAIAPRMHGAFIHVPKVIGGSEG